MSKMSSKSLIVPLYSKLLSHFPKSLTFCFAYGSGVKKQINDKKPEANMIDFIFCVENASHWHEENLKLNHKHYSSLRYLGHNAVAKYQENFGAKVYYNTLVNLDGVLIKYGVISRKDLVTDLLEWSDLYLAGRLHKPVEIVRDTLNSELKTALQLNLQSAVHAALLLLPDSFTEYQFYHTISNLSYKGDFRMYFGENKNKVSNIVKPQMNGFRNLYKPLIKSLHDFVEFPYFYYSEDEGESAVDNSVSNSENLQCLQDAGPIAKLHHLNQLPRWPQKALTKYWNRGPRRQDTEDVLRAIAFDPECADIVEHCISGIVWNSSVRQSLKSIVTAGMLKSLRYSSRKILKMFK